MGGNAYTVDNDGNLTAYPGVTLTYDQANRLKTYASGATTTTYVYDGDGKRASKTVGATTTSYQYDANCSLPVVLTDGSLKYVYCHRRGGHVPASAHRDDGRLRQAREGWGWKRTRWR